MSSKIKYLDKHGLDKVLSLLKGDLRTKPTCKDKDGEPVNDQNIVVLTRAEYDALAVKDPDTYYMTTNDGTTNVMDIYSTEEIKTNKVWIDGKPIYRRVFEIYKNGVLNGWTYSYANGVTTFTYTAGLGFIDTLISNACLTSNGILTSYGSGTYAEGIKRYDTNAFVIANGSAATFKGTVATLILEYTKTTD